MPVRLLPLISDYEERGDEAVISVVPSHKKEGTEKWVRGIAVVKLAQIAPPPDVRGAMAILREPIHHSQVQEVDG